MVLCNTRQRFVRHGFSWFGAALVSVMFLSTMACGSDVALPPRSLASPSGVAVARRCDASIGGERIYTDPERCGEGGDIADGSIVTWGLVANRDRESLMVVNLDASAPSFTDLDPGEPNITGILVCTGPSRVVTTPDGLFALVLCDASRSLSVVAVPALREVLRLQRGALETDMAAAPDDALVAFARPELGEIRVERLSYDCDGVSDSFRADCLPQVEMTVEATWQTAAEPSHLAMGSDGRLYASYRDKGYLSVFTLTGSGGVTCLDPLGAPPCEIARLGLTSECSNRLDDDEDGLADQDDPQCYGPGGAESPEGSRGVLFACTNGVDDDGDGLLDHDDPDCLSEIDDNESGGVVPGECDDGEDNDGDTFTDQEDPDCLVPGWFVESSPTCGNGLDDDQDGDTDFPDDSDCPSAAWSDESRPPACQDGIDNDDDGATDFPDDPDCAGELMDQEEGGPDCRNGLDDDGDGVVDRADPGCNDPWDESEQAAPAVCSDTVDNDGDGLVDTDDPDCYGATGSSESSFAPDGFGPIALQRNEEYLLVVDPARHQLLVLDVQAGLLLDAGADDPLHSGLGIPLSRSVIRQPLGYTLSASSSTDTVETGLEEEVAVVPSSDGLGTLVSIRTTHYAGTGEDRQEGITFPLRPRDGNSLEAEADRFNCEVPEEFQVAIRAARGTTEAVRIHCDDPEVPHLVPLSDSERVAVASEQQFVLEGEAVVEQTVAADWRVRTEDWTLSYEGVIDNSDRTDGLIDDRIPGLLVSAGVNFCSLGVQVGDHLVIEKATPSLQAPADACAPFLGDTALEYGIGFVRADALYLEVFEDEPQLVQALPTRECFSAGFAYEIRPERTWVVSGESSGFLHPRTALSEQCLPGTRDALWTGRLVEGEPFCNPFFCLDLEPGTVAHTRDTAISFSVSSNFATTAIGLGPLPMDSDYAETRRGPRILISDGGVNAVYIFDAASLLLVTTLL